MVVGVTDVGDDLVGVERIGEPSPVEVIEERAARAGLALERADPVVPADCPEVLVRHGQDAREAQEAPVRIDLDVARRGDPDGAVDA